MLQQKGYSRKATIAEGLLQRGYYCRGATIAEGLL